MIKRELFCCCVFPVVITLFSSCVSFEERERNTSGCCGDLGLVSSLMSHEDFFPL